MRDSKTQASRCLLVPLVAVVLLCGTGGCGGQGDGNNELVKGNGGQSNQSPDSKKPQVGKSNDEKPTDVMIPVARKSWNAQNVITLRGHKDIVAGRIKASVNSVAFSPDGKRLVSGSNDRTVKVWDAYTGQELLTLRGHRSYVTSVAFSPDGRRIVSGSYDRSVKVWDAHTGQEHLTLRGHMGTVYSVAFSPDGKRIVSGGGIVAEKPKSEVKVWNATTGKPLFSLTGHSSWVNSVAFGPDGKRIVTGSDDGTVKLWDAGNGREIMTLRHVGNVQSVAFSSDGKRIASGGWDATVKVWDAHSGRKLLTFRDHTKEGFAVIRFVNAVAFSPNGNFVVSGSNDHTVKVVEVSSGKTVFSAVSNLARGTRDDLAVSSVAFSPDGRRLASANADRTVKIWTVAERARSLDANPEVDDVVKRFNEIPTTGKDIAYASNLDVPSNPSRDHIQGVGQIGNRFVLSHSDTPIISSASRPSLIFIAASSGNRSDWRASFKGQLDARVQDRDDSGNPQTHYLGHVGAIQCIGNCIAVPFEAPNRNEGAQVKIYRVVNWERQIVSRVQQIRVDPACAESPRSTGAITADVFGNRSAASVGITHDGSKYVMAVFNYSNSRVYIAHSEPNKRLDECNFTWVTKHTMPNNYQGGLSLVTEAGNGRIKQVWALGFYTKEDGGEWGSYVDLLRFNSQSQSFREVPQGTKKLFNISGKNHLGPNCRWGGSCMPERNCLVVSITCRGIHRHLSLLGNRIRVLRCETPSP